MLLEDVIIIISPIIAVTAQTPAPVNAFAKPVFTSPPNE